MSGGRKTRSSKPKMQSENLVEHDDKDVGGGQHGEVGGEHAAAPQQEQLHKGLMDFISNEMKGLKNEITDTLSKFKEEFKQDIRQEFTDFKEEMNVKLEAINKEMQSQKKEAREVQERIAETEQWNMEAKDAVLLLLNQQKKLQSQLTDLSARSRRNNMRIFNVAESATEDDKVTDFVNKLLHKELKLSEHTDLEIQRCHRATVQKPPDGANPRSIVVNFLQYETKEKVLKEAWQTDIKLEGKKLGFDHDYPVEVLAKRKEYAELKPVLKKHGVGFSTPFTRMKIRWGTGTRVYDSALEAARDMKKRGLDVHVREPETTMEDRIRAAAASQWQRAGRREDPGTDEGNDGQAVLSPENRAKALRRAKERLHEFRR